MPAETGVIPDFKKVVSGITDLGKNWHSEALLAHAERNAPLVKKTIAELPPEKRKRAVVVSAGPSLHRFDVIKKIKDSGFSGAVICIDGSYVKCLRGGLIPDYMLSLDPHPTRIARWFGDPDYEKNMAGDDYWERQDLDVEFRKNTLARNQENIDLVDANGSRTKMAICSSAPENVVRRAQEGGFDLYWWNPLVDDPRQEGSLTRRIYKTLKSPCMNTGGTVGTAAWVFATTILKIPEVAVVGMDLGYPAGTPLKNTQTYYELIEHLGGEERLAEYFPEFVFPLTGEKYFTDPTYFWYRKNILELLAKAPGRTVNCTEAGTLFGSGVECARLSDFLAGR